jgi:hypothetical protein
MDSKLSDFAAINPAIVAAIIGAVVAIFGIFIRDLIIATLIKKREERIKVLHEKLSNLYSPLMFYLGGPTGPTHKYSQSLLLIKSYVN